MIKNIEKGLQEKEEDKAKQKAMSYMNLNKKVTELGRMGLLEEMKSDLSTINKSGRFRRDYKVTMKGLSCLMPYIITHSDDIKMITEYMDKSGLDKQVFGDALVSNVISVIDSANQYLGSLNRLQLELAPKGQHIADIERLGRSMTELKAELDSISAAAKPKPITTVTPPPPPQLIAQSQINQPRKGQHITVQGLIERNEELRQSRLSSPEEQKRELLEKQDRELDVTDEIKIMEAQEDLYRRRRRQRQSFKSESKPVPVKKQSKSKKH